MEGQNYNCKCHHPSQCDESCIPKFEWTTVGYRYENDSLVYFRERNGKPAPEAIEVSYSYPDVYIHRLKDAVEGECEGLAISDHQAHQIIKWVLFEKE